MSAQAAIAQAPLPIGKSLPSELQKALGRVTEIASLPEVTTRIVEVVEDQRSTARDIQDVVRADPALAGKILKIVNSAFYGLPAQIASLDRAILMLGLSAVRNLALASSLARFIKDGEICSQFNTRDLWRHSIAVGVATRLLAGAVRSAQADEAFVAGLMHDMGLIIVQQLFPEKLRQVAETCIKTGQDFRVLEQTIIGADHQTFGAALATKWKFPPGLRYAIGYHHEPGALQPEFQKVTTMVHAADVLCCQQHLGFWLTEQKGTAVPATLALAGLTPEHLTAATTELPQMVADAERVFGEA